MIANRRTSGFTLIEITIVLALVGMMSVLMIEALRFGQRAYGQVVEANLAGEDVMLAQRFLRRTLEGAYPFAASRGVGAPLEGSGVRVTFSAPAPQSSGGMGLQRYAVERTGSNLIVHRHVDRNGADDSAATSDDGEVLLPNVADVEWSYLGTEWSHEWHDASALPALIRVRVTFAPGDRRRWPDLIVAPRVTHDANCTFDLVAQDCRKSS